MIKFVYVSPETWTSLVSEYDVSAAQTGVELLRDLLIPRRSDVRNVLLADLPSPDWFKCITRSIATLPPQIRNHARTLVEKLATEALIPLPLPGAASRPTSGWQELGERALSEDAVDLLLTLSGDENDSQRVPTTRLSDDQWLAESFQTAVTIPRDGVGQERILRRLLQNNQWCVLQFPYIKGYKGDELFTVRQVIQLACEMVPATLQRVDLVLNVELGADPATLIDRIRPELTALKQRPPNCRIRVFRSPESFLDREMLFGTLNQQPRWYVTAGHVAIHQDGSRDTTTWTLRSRKDARDACHRLKQLADDERNLLFSL